MAAIENTVRPLSVINERALKLSPNPRVTNSSRALAGLRRRGLVKGYYTTATGSPQPPLIQKLSILPHSCLW